MKNGKKTRQLVFLLLAVILAFSSSCAYKERVQPVSLPGSGPNSIVIDGVGISAVAFVDKETADDAFGFDIRGAGLLPVQVVIQNDGDRPVSLLPEQTFLVGAGNQAWPVLPLEKTYARVEKHVDVGETVAGTAKPALLLGAAGAIAGLAVGIVTGENIGGAMGKGAAIGAAAGAIGGGASGYLSAREEIREDLSQKALENKRVQPNQIGYGMLFFPGFPEEAQTASDLRLTLSFAGEIRSVTLHLLPATN
jgi:hypothetical protein